MNSTSAVRVVTTTNEVRRRKSMGEGPDVSLPALEAFLGVSNVVE